MIYPVGQIGGVTVRVTVASAETPTEFVACKVNDVASINAVGVPEITQVVACTVRVPGRAVVADFIPHAVMAAPLAFKVVGETDMALLIFTEVPVAPE